MRTLSLTITFSLFLSIGTAFGQLKSMINPPEDSTIQRTTLLTPEMFFDASPQFNFNSLPTAGKTNQELAPIFDNRITKLSLVLGRSLLANKNDLQSSGSFTPFTVSDYNRQIRQQFFMAEPTSQQRRSLPPFRW
ncbi:hypothetical protein [Rhodohalobacter halophilus]|uniref:hypothetical protein n=1 Tax=Rhodohalobacter halophilus TaxID=1812810 RepID=UPI00083F939C|nr:hypothetical protein [Rhodohalobacter halophilus]